MGKLHQLHTAISCSFPSVLTGMLYVWPSYTLGLYTASDTVLLTTPMTEMESSLLGSLPSLGAMFGTVMVGMIISKFGRQKGGVILALPYIVSWIMVDLTKSSMAILVARFVGGFGCGAVLVYAPIFISEIAEESIRGTLASVWIYDRVVNNRFFMGRRINKKTVHLMFSDPVAHGRIQPLKSCCMRVVNLGILVPVASYCLGMQMSYILGWALSYRYILWVNLACSVLAVVLIMTVTESPVYLLRQNREEEARLAIAHYRSESPTSKVVLEEISRLKLQITPAVELIEMNNDDNIKAEEAEKEKLNIENNTPAVKARMSSFKILFTSPSSRRGFFIVGAALTLQVLMGMVAVQVYAKHIFTLAAPSLSSHFCSVMFAMFVLIGSIASLLVTDKFGRKFLIITSSISVALCLAAMGLLMQTGIAPPWVTALLILMYCFFFILGAGSIPYVLMAECFVPEVQSLASTLLMEWVWLLNFFIIGVFPFMIKFFGIHGSFYVFTIFSILNSVVGLFLVPETKGLTNEQIQEALLRRKK